MLKSGKIAALFAFALLSVVANSGEFNLTFLSLKDIMDNAVLEVPPPRPKTSLFPCFSIYRRRNPKPLRSLVRAFIPASVPLQIDTLRPSFYNNFLTIVAKRLLPLPLAGGGN